MRCPNCQSLFFKTLEVRFLDVDKDQKTGTLLMKKRCKRCKYKYFFAKHYPSNQVRLVTHDTWEKGRKSLDVRTSEGFQIFVSEYTREISRGRSPKP